MTELEREQKERARDKLGAKSPSRLGCVIVSLLLVGAVTIFVVPMFMVVG